MIKDVMESIGFIEWFGILALILFFLVFAGVLIRTLRFDGATLQTLAQLPLDSAAVPAEKRESADD